MIAYVTVGADDLARAKRFYRAFLPALGYGLKERAEGLSFALSVEPGQSPAPPDFFVKPTFDGRPASAGNGAMVAFEAHSQSQVRYMARIFTFATCVTLKVTRSLCSQVIQMSPDETHKGNSPSAPPLHHTPLYHK